MEHRIVLASGSPRRREILEQLGACFTCRISTKEEVIRSTNPKEVVLELSQMKAEDVAGSSEGPVLVIGADTVVAYKGSILGKPKDKEDAVRMLSALAGNTHEVYTGVCMICKESDGTERKISFAEVTQVTVYPMKKEEIERYVDTGEPMDKAGAYAIQGLFAPFIRKIDGDYYNIVGFPIAGIFQRLKEMGIELFS